jgi:hypothetical protein
MDSDFTVLAKMAEAETVALPQNSTRIVALDHIFEKAAVNSSFVTGSFSAKPESNPD